MFIRSLLVAASLVFAASNATAGNSAGYDRLVPWFESGTTFDFSASMGWYTGRCWEAGNENAIAALIILDERVTDGPAFPPVQKMQLVLDRKRSASYYDALTGLEMSEIRSAFNTSWKGLPLLRVDALGFTQGLNTLRRSADAQYLILGAVSSSYSHENLMCYFFKRVDA